MSAPGFTPISLYHSTTAAATPSAGNLAAGELAVNITDGKLFYKDNGGVVRVLATAAGSAGDVVGPGSSTDNALVRFDGTTGKLVQNSAGVLDDSGNLTGIAALTTSGALTLNGGTANGVAYLNGSKVLTTGSALTFDGTNFGVGTGGNTLNQQSVVYKVGANAVYQQIANGSTGLGAANGVRLGVSNGGTGELYSPTALISYIDNSEQMRLTSTGLGIGTSSPAAKLDVRGNAVFTGNGTSRQTADFTNTGGQLYVGTESSSGGAVFVGSSAYAGIVGTNTNTHLQLGTNGTIKATLDSSGNLGLGVTPSAWASSIKSIQVGSSGFPAFIADVAGDSFFGYNAYNDGVWRYRNNFNASAIQQTSGAFRFLTAPSGTAGNAISFTQAMTLNSSGQLILNGTSAQTACVLTLQETSGISSALAFKNRNNTQTWNIAVDATAIDDKILAFIDPNAGVVRMGLDSLGNLLVGTTTTPVGNRVNGHYFYADGGYNSRTVSSKRDWGISVTSGAIVNFYSDNGSAAVYAGSINVNGNVTSYTSVSDYRLKENVKPMRGALSQVLALKPVTYTFKDGGQKAQGFIAHELQSVVPDCVTGEKDAVDADGNPQYQGIDTSFLVATLTAAIQEQQAIITALTARVAALESN